MKTRYFTVVRYILNTISDAYSDFESRLNLVKEKLSAQQLVETAFFAKIGKVTKSDIIEMCPTISASSVEKAIAVMVQTGKILKEGSGKNTFYVRNEK